MNRKRAAIRCVITAITGGAVALAGGCASSPESGKPRSPAAEVAKPSIRLEVEPDPDSGWNLHLITGGFRFAPERAGRAAKPGEGHAHLYLDGRKIARIYGPWHHLDAGQVPKGRHTLTVKLNANDHTPLTNNGKPVQDSAGISSTGRSESGHHHPKPSKPPATPKADVNATVEILEGKVQPPVGRVTVKRGQTVRLVVRSDVPDSVHVHGYDLEQDVKPGGPAIFEFTADQTGLFEVETHDSGLVLAQLAVR